MIYEDMSTKDLQYDCEVVMAIKCHRDSMVAEKNGEDYQCKCEDPMKWTREDCLLYLNNINIYGEENEE